MAAGKDAARSRRGAWEAIPAVSATAGASKMGAQSKDRNEMDGIFTQTQHSTFAGKHLDLLADV